MDDLLQWLMQHGALALMGAALSMALWHQQHEDDVRDTRKAVDTALVLGDLQQKDIEIDLEIDKAQLSRSLDAGGNLAMLIVMARRYPVFGAALLVVLGELITGVSRYERLLAVADLDRLPPREPKKCQACGDGRPSSMSSVAS
jgi:hypothetical protein